ncbi:FAD-binding oxidoreductase [Bacillus sp. FJAT-29790]|uniref:NAD(P)/FAD-dependent oxidoreductase n=1 Tax=Bacillus sp. FJAT-29790 TaxID=1895002 RepID=UPI001C242347|nr:FAD-binding oxidoreductase [Bacillus sp. FJAT-29790]MBU8879283.1 FAD-binding oxidoreductase [Bacillus sp. FJAT-29790]
MKQYPVWEATERERINRTSLTGDKECDVVIIGGGFSGLSTAYHLQKSNCQTTILEKGRIGDGASGKNGGQMLTGYVLSMSQLAKKYGLNKAKQMLHMTLDSIDLIEKIIKENAILCDFHREGHLNAAYKPSHLEALKREQEILMRDFEYEVNIIEKQELHHELNSPLYVGGCVDENSAIFHPLNYALGLAKVIEQLGGTVFENSEAVKIERNSKDKVIVTTNEGRVIADHIVIVTNGYSGDLHKIIGRTIVPVESIMIATEPISPDILNGLIKKNRGIYDTKNLLYYFRKTEDHRLAFGGSGRTTSKRDAKRLFLQLHAGMLQVFPELKNINIEYEWSGKVGFTKEKIPYMGQLEDGTHFAFGYAGHGAAMSTLMGKLIAANVLATGEGRNPLEKTHLKPIPFYSQHAKAVSIMKYYFKLLDKLS